MLVKSRKNETGTEEEEKVYWNIWNLIPTEEHGYTKSEEAEYRYKMLCYIAAKGDSELQDRFYKECSLVRVWEQIVMDRAANW